MMAMTTRSSINVNPRRSLLFMEISLSNEKTTRKYASGEGVEINMYLCISSHNPSWWQPLIGDEG